MSTELDLHQPAPTPAPAHTRTQTALAVTKTVAIFVLWTTPVFTLRVIWAVAKWAGRVVLWIVFWPLAMVKARKRHSKQQTDRIVAALEKQQKADG